MYPLRVRDPAAYRAEKAAAQRAFQSFQQRHRSPSTTSSAQPSTAVAQPATAVSGGLDAAGLDATIGGRGLSPPDTTGAIGPTRYLELVNSEIAVYDRSTLASPPVAELDESTFVGSSFGTCDGQVQWDQQGQRWLYAALACDPNAQGIEALYFGWSKTPDPTNLSAGSWCQYAISTGSSLEDYPKLGHDDGQLIIGTNAFDDTTNAYTGSHIFLIDKPSPADTTCPTASSLGASTVEASADFTPVPANIADASATGYVVSLSSADSSHLTLYAVGTSGGLNAVLGTTSVAVPTFGVPAPVPQPGTSDSLDSSDARLTQAVAITDPATGGEGIWTQHTVAGPGGGPSVVRWYELTPGATAPRQSGTITGPNGTFAFNGAISPTADTTAAASSAALFYNSGDGSQLVDLRAQDRRAGTPLGEMTEDLRLATSTAADQDFGCMAPNGPPCRWGDYAGASPDPSNHSIVWGTGELTTLSPDGSGGAQWGTRNVALDTSSASPSPPTAAISQPATGGYYTTGQPVTTSFSCAEGTGGPGLASCTDSNGTSPPSGRLDTSTLGNHTYTVTATSIDGLTGTASIAYAVAAPPSVSVAAPAAGALYPQGAAVPAGYGCSEGAYGPGIASCTGTVPTGAPIDASTAGQHTFTVTATSGDGQSATRTVGYTVAAAPSASISSPTPGALYNRGQAVQAAYACAEGAYGPGLSSCTGTIPNGGALDTTTAGPHTVTVTATSSDGQSTTAAATYTVAAPPSASIAAPTAGGAYLQGAVVRARYTCSEGAYGPGLASCTGTVANAAAIDTSSIGAHALTVAAASGDGQAGTATVTYTVLAPPRIAILTARTPVVNSFAKVKLGCAGGLPGSVCHGTLTLAERMKTTQLPRVDGRRWTIGVFRTVIVAHARYALPSGASRPIRLRLSRAALMSLTNARGHPLQLRAIATLDGGPTATRTIIVRLKPPPPRRR